MINKKNKRGELTTQQLVMLIILIASFVIILFLIYRLNLGKQTDSEICRNSVILKSKSFSSSGPVNCKTNYLCVSSGSKCSDIVQTSETNVKKNNKDEVMKSLADEMSNCWWEFGEGKINYADVVELKKTACSVCSVVSFGSDLQNGEKISYHDFYDYLRATKKTDSQTYLQYLYSTSDLNTFSSNFNPADYLNNNLDLSKRHFILTGYFFPKDRLFASAVPQSVVILEDTEENYQKVVCDVFLTKA